MKKYSAIFTSIVLSAALLFGCGSSTATNDAASEAQSQESALADGVYTAEFETDSTMFHVNETCDGCGTLTVADGQMTIHISLPSKSIVNLYVGLAEDARKDGAQLLEPTTDTVTYDDGTSEEVNGFDVPVPALDEEFDLALIGTKGVWYDHKVSVSNPQSIEDSDETASDETSEETSEPETSDETVAELTDGTYEMELTFEGGSGKAYIESPAIVNISGDTITATVTWSSENYDYMLLDGEKYLPVNTEGVSVFEIPVAALDEPMTVIGDTVAMSKPHEIEYTLTFHSDTAKEVTE